MTKPRILITMHYMEIGGAESALLGLLMAFDYSRYDVDLFIYAHRGELMPYIPKEVNLLPEVPVYASIESPMCDALRKGHLRLVMRRLWAKVRHRRYRQRLPATGDDYSIMQYVGDSVIPILPPINPRVEYDLAISFLTPHNICRDKVRAKQKIAWIHTDYSFVDINRQMELPVWGAFDHIVAISDDVRRAFVGIFPSLESKVFDMENILSPGFVRSRANEFDASAELAQASYVADMAHIGGGKSLDHSTLHLSEES